MNFQERGVNKDVFREEYLLVFSISNKVLPAKTTRACGEKLPQAPIS